MREVLMVGLLVAFSLIMSCQKEDISIQENPAMHNHLIESSRVFTGADYLDIFSARAAENGSFFYLGAERLGLSRFYIEYIRINEGLEPAIYNFSNKVIIKDIYVDKKASSLQCVAYLGGNSFSGRYFHLFGKTNFQEDRDADSWLAPCEITNFDSLIQCNFKIK